MKSARFMGPSLDDMPVFFLPGVGHALGGRLFDQGYRVAADVYKEYINCKRDLTAFQEWMKKVSNAKKSDAELCYKRFKWFEEQYGEYKIGKKTKTDDDIDDVDRCKSCCSKHEDIDMQLKKLSLGKGVEPEISKGKQQEHTKLLKESDELGSFFFSTLNTVRTLSKPVQLQVKREINEIVSNAKDLIKPYKIYNSNRDKMEEIVAESLEDLITKACKLPGFTDELRDNNPHYNTNTPTVVLDRDGTEVNDERYFSTLDPGTSFMILQAQEKWSLPTHGDSLDQPDDVGESGVNKNLLNLVNLLIQDVRNICSFNDEELDMLAEMKPASLAGIVKGQDDLNQLKRIKEVCERIMVEKREAQDAMRLLRLYHKAKTANGYVTPPTECSN